MWSRPSGPAKVLRYIQSQDSFKLKALGMDGTALFCMDSYLEGSSRLRMVGSCGVPQASVLGSLLFLHYRNDMKPAGTLFSYAHDSAIFVTHKGRTQEILIDKLLKTL